MSAGAGLGEPPRFAVVGRVNKGKSSVVATLAEDDRILIDARPGTTTEVREYPVTVDGRTLFVLLDTPGFEDAPRALAWLRREPSSAAERPTRVEALLRAHEGSDALVEERRLLAPILAGASILYVVDGAHPFRPNYEAEMEILRWTGQPGMALVNRIGPGDHGAEWHRALGQYFRLVRDFDAQAVSFEARLGLLRAFRELRPEWGGAIDEALEALLAQRRRRRAEAAAEIADGLSDALTLVQEAQAEDPAALKAAADRLERGFHDALRAREEQGRRRVEAIFGHGAARFEGEALARPVLLQDLFAEETWQVLGLSPAQLLAAGTVAGATVGGAVDAMVGGASFLAGTVVGGLVGGGGALYGLGRRFARVRAAGAPGLPGLWVDARRLVSGQRSWVIGPHAAPNFPWVLLDRALLHYEAVARRTHALRGTVALRAGGTGLVASLGRRERRALEAIFRKLRRAAPDPPRAARDALEREVARLLARLEPLPGDASPRDR